MAFDIEKFLNTPLHAFDQTSVFGDLKEFLEFSKRTLSGRNDQSLDASNMR
jgi:hypothetical protein